ncbi:MAG: elongation factor P hydroxylase [Litorivicinaceae bacterium]
MTDAEYCAQLIRILHSALPELQIEGGHPEPFYRAPRDGKPGCLQFRSDYPRSLLHELAHYCLAGDKRRTEDDFGYWYAPEGRSITEQAAFEAAEVRPQALEWLFCECVGLPFSPSRDDFSGRPDPGVFLDQIRDARAHLQASMPPTAARVLRALSACV